MREERGSFGGSQFVAARTGRGQPGRGTLDLAETPMKASAQCWCEQEVNSGTENLTIILTMIPYSRYYYIISFIFHLGK